MSIVEKCLNSISKAKRFNGLNIFIRDTFEAAKEQAEKSAIRISKQSKFGLVAGAINLVNRVI
jgi:hypothetical protein